MSTYYAAVEYLQGVPWVQLMVAFQWFFLLYFVCINLGYLALNYISVFSIVRYMRDHRSEYLPRSLHEYQPPVSILLPAYNEETSIVSSVQSLLKINYPEFEIVVVNDGSTDKTLEALVQAFSMVDFPEAYRQRIETAHLRGTFASTKFPRVRIVDKDNGGKPDALNAGINVARYPLFCVVDADCILQPDSLSRVVRPFLEDPDTIASGGVVRVLNGCKVEDGFLKKVDLPKAILPTFQLVEYLRAFLFGRMGWSPIGAMLIISGAFGVFYKERVIAIGGYRTDTVGEDMDLVVRLHRNMRQEKRKYKITFVPDPICWTEAPSDLNSLKNQRVRWQRGLAESLWPNLGLMFNLRGGTVGWIAFPFMLIFEFFGPLIEVTGYVMMITLWLLNLIPLTTFLIFLAAAMGLGVLLSTNALFLEEISFHLYPKPRQQLRLFLMAILENFGYRQLNSLWRMIGLLKWVFSGRRRSRWGKIERDGSWQHPPPEHATQPPTQDGVSPPARVSA